MTQLSKINFVEVIQVGDDYVVAILEDGKWYFVERIGNEEERACETILYLLDKRTAYNWAQFLRYDSLEPEPKAELIKVSELMEERAEEKENGNGEKQD